MAVDCAFENCGHQAVKRGYCDAHYAQARTGGPLRPVRYRRSDRKVCVVCGATDWPANGRRRYCSPRCEQLASRRRRGENSLDEVTCEACGEVVPILAVARERKQRTDTRYCGTCRRLKAIRLVGHGVVTIVQVRALGSTCALCRGAIDFDATEKHRRPSLDHIVPRALGGTDDLSNLQLTHFGCNQKKHLRPSAEGFGIDERQRFYSLRRWRRLSAEVRAEEPRCRLCDAPASCVDHIVGIEEGGARWERSNLQSLCRRCHLLKSQREYRARWSA